MDGNIIGAEEKNILELKSILETANINFLIGAGLSAEFMSCLGNIEDKLNQLEQDLEKIDDCEKRKILKAEREKLLKKVFTHIIYPNFGLINCFFDCPDESHCKKRLFQHTKLLKTLYRILVRRETSTVCKQINLFTTNYDILLECVLEKNNIRFNDGFGCGFSPQYNPNNFKQITLQKGLFLEKHSEIPTFNVVKLHGSVSWRKEKSSEHFGSLPYQDIKEHIEECYKNKTYSNFFDTVGAILPSNYKFRDTLLVRTYYELMRFFSSELEKMNAVLFVVGFSFEDSHIKELVEKAADANPTLRVYIFVYEDSKNIFEKMSDKALNKNISIIKDQKYTISKISDYFGEIFREIHQNSERKR